MMMNAVGDHLLRIIGKRVGIPGILLSSDLTPAIQALEFAVREEQSHLTKVADWSDFKGYAGSDTVTLRQSAWPLLEMMKRARIEDQAIVWGV